MKRNLLFVAKAIISVFSLVWIASLTRGSYLRWGILWSDDWKVDQNALAVRLVTIVVVTALLVIMPLHERNAITVKKVLTSSLVSIFLCAVIGLGADSLCRLFISNSIDNPRPWFNSILYFVVRLVSLCLIICLFYFLFNKSIFIKNKIVQSSGVIISILVLLFYIFMLIYTFMQLGFFSDGLYDKMDMKLIASVTNLYQGEPRVMLLLSIEMILGQITAYCIALLSATTVVTVGLQCHREK